MGGMTQPEQVKKIDDNTRGNPAGSTTKQG